MNILRVSKNGKLLVLMNLVHFAGVNKGYIISVLMNSVVYFASVNGTVDYFSTDELDVC